MTAESAAVNVTKCPFCEINGKVGELKNAGGRSWVCELCGHEFPSIDAVLRALNVARTKQRLLQAEKKRADGAKTVKVWKELPVESGPMEQTAFEFEELRCWHCNLFRKQSNQSLYMHRARRKVGWYVIEGRYFCPKCYWDRKYDLY